MGVPENKKIQIFIITYFLFLSLVPGSPSYYRLMVDTVGCILSLLSLISLELYLRSRPINQINILHSHQHLIFYLQLVFAVRFWIISAAGSLFHDLTSRLIESYPRVIVTLFATRVYTMSLGTAYCTMSISKIILLLSPAVFQNLSHRKGFWVSAGTVMTITLMDMILNVIKCGGGTRDEHDPLEHTKTFMYELGMANDTFGEAVSKISLSENSGENNDVEDKCRAYFPTTKIIVIATFLLEIVKLILAILIDIRKTIQRKNRVANISKPSPTQLRPCSPQLNSSSLHLTSTTSSEPEDIATEILSHCSTVIYVRPAPDMSENVPAIVDTLPNIAETIELTDDNNFVVEDISPTIDETVPALDNTSPALDNTAPALDNTAPAALGYTVAALGHTAPALSQTAPALDNIAPALDNIAPALDNIPPALGHTAPALDNIAPDLSLTIADTSPTVADTSPTVANTSLTVADTSHTVADTSPTVANTSPTVADNSPSHTFMTEDSTPMTADNTAINVTATMISDAPDKGDKKAFTPLAETVLADEESSIFEGATNVNVEGMSLEETGSWLIIFMN